MIAMAHTAALQQTTAVTSNSLIYNAGARVCSLALRSVTETKDTVSGTVAAAGELWMRH